MGTTIMRTRDVAIDFVKVIATLLVLNSHMGICYGDYSAIATGGGLGDGLFFFISGFTLFLGKRTNFIDWYKRRLGRIFPTVIAVALVSCLIFGNQENFIQVMSVEKYWFLQCILICYIVMYPIVRYDLNLKVIFPMSFVVFLFAYFFLYQFDGELFYGVNNTFRWLVYFSVMLLGGFICKNSHQIQASKFSILWTFLCVVAWYGVNYLAKGSWLQLLSFFPLIGFCVYAYQLGRSSFIEKCFKNKIAGNILYIIGNLCLESYLIQKLIFTDALNHLFPLNILIIMVAVLLAAYILHGISEIISQIFDSKPFDRKRLFLQKPS